MPTAIPNYKKPPEVSNEDRLEMLNLALQNNDHYKIDSLEIMQDTYSPSYKTLSFIRSKVGPTTPIYYIIGEDSLINLDTWDSWEDLLNLTNFIVLKRPLYTSTMMSPKLRDVFEKHKTTNYNNLTVPCGKIYLLDFVLSDISSTEIRSRIKSGLSISDYVPINVLKYILQHTLYKE